MHSSFNLPSYGEPYTRYPQWNKWNSNSQPPGSPMTIIPLPKNKYSRSFFIILFIIFLIPLIQLTRNLSIKVALPPPLFLEVEENSPEIFRQFDKKNAKTLDTLTGEKKLFKTTCKCCYRHRKN